MHEEWTLLKRLIWLWRVVMGGASSVLRTVTGATIHITDALAKPAHELVAVLKPQQDLHGYDHPWPGDSAGLLPVAEKATKTVNGTTIVSDSGSFLIQSSNMTSGTKIRFNLTRSFTVPSDKNNYKICFNGGASGSTALYLTFVYDDGTEYSVSPLYVDDRVISPVPSSMAGKTIVAIEFYAYSDVGPVKSKTISPQIVPIDVENGYYQGSNICLISGWTGADIEQRGKNLAIQLSDPTQPDLGFRSSGGGTTPVQYDTTEQAYYVANHRSFNIVFNKDGVAVLSLYIKKKGTPSSASFAFLGSNQSGNIYNSIPATIGNTSDTEYTRVYLARNVTKGSSIGITVYSSVFMKDLQLEFALNATNYTPTDYEPYKSRTIPINWQSEAGTIYSGPVTLNEDGSADVIVDKGYLEYDGSDDEVWDYEVTALGVKNFFVGVPNIRDYKNYTYGLSSICNIATQGMQSRVLNGQFNVDYPYNCIDFGIAEALGFYTVPELKTYLANNPIQLALGLVTPVSYHFDNIGQLVLFLGENNIWVDASDDLTLTYYADGNVSDEEALNTLLGGMYSPDGDVSDREALNILLGN